MQTKKGKGQDKVIVIDDDDNKRNKDDDDDNKQEEEGDDYKMEGQEDNNDESESTEHSDGAVFVVGDTNNDEEIKAKVQWVPEICCYKCYKWNAVKDLTGQGYCVVYCSNCESRFYTSMWQA